jgi:hypothetical protein
VPVFAKERRGLRDLRTAGVQAGRASNAGLGRRVPAWRLFHSSSLVADGRRSWGSTLPWLDLARAQPWYDAMPGWPAGRCWAVTFRGNIALAQQCCPNNLNHQNRAGAGCAHRDII